MPDIDDPLPLGGAELGERIHGEISGLRAEIERLRAALEKLLDHYTQLINSGDAGFWDPEEEQVVIEARAALENRHG